MRDLRGLHIVSFTDGYMLWRDVATGKFWVTLEASRRALFQPVMLNYN